MHSWDQIFYLVFGRAPKYRTKGCSRILTPEIRGWKWPKSCKNQCSRSRAVNGRAWTPFCDTLGWLSIGVGVQRNLSHLSSPVRDTPPYRAIPFRDSIAEGGIAPICLVFIGYRASIAEIPLLRGVSHLHFACSPRGKRSEKGEGVSHPIGHVETPKTP